MRSYLGKSRIRHIYKLLTKGINKRQADLVAHLYAKKDAVVNISSYSARNEVVRQTAGKDLNELITIGLINEEKIGRDIVLKVMLYYAMDLHYY